MGLSWQQGPLGGAFRDSVAFAWHAMDAFYEEDERILGHAADPYHRIDIRRASRHLVVRDDDRVVDRRSRVEEPPGQNVIAHGPDRTLSVDEIGGIQLLEGAAAAQA